MRKLLAVAGIVILAAGLVYALSPSTTNAPKVPVKSPLTPLQYKVTQEKGTEAPFNNPYWNNHEDGIYVDIVSGEPLFSSLDKYDSGTGWPSFTKPLDSSAVIFKPDHDDGMDRTEVRSKKADSHLGHVFDDGPAPTGKRFCMNSASLKFIPVDKLKEEGLGRFLFLFAAKKNWETAVLGGGCFWGVENIIRQIPGVIETETGYAGGSIPNPTYEQVSSGTTGYAESVHVLFDPKKLSYEELLKYFFRLHDPTTVDRQENDVGTQYRSVIFYANEKQKKTAEEVKAKVDRSGKWGKPVVTEILPLGQFWRAEEHHQKYLVKNPHGYNCHFIRKFKFD